MVDDETELCEEGASIEKTEEDDDDAAEEIEDPYGYLVFWVDMRSGVGAGAPTSEESIGGGAQVMEDIEER